MSWLIDWTRPALHDMRRLDQQAAQRIERAVDRLATNGQGDVVQLQGSRELYRLRVGDWRVVFSYDRTTDPWTLHVIRVLPRGRAYR